VKHEPSVVGCTIGSRGEVPGKRKPVIRDDDMMMMMMMMIIIIITTTTTVVTIIKITGTLLLMCNFQAASRSSS
jgi:hypothetical protein